MMVHLHCLRVVVLLPLYPTLDLVQLGSELFHLLIFLLQRDFQLCFLFFAVSDLLHNVSLEIRVDFLRILECIQDGLLDISINVQ